MTGLRVAVVGAGIGRLTAAIAARQRHRSHRLRTGPRAQGARRRVAIATNGSPDPDPARPRGRGRRGCRAGDHYQFRTWQAQPITGEPSTHWSFGDPAGWFLHRDFQKVLAGALRRPTPCSWAARASTPSSTVPGSGPIRRRGTTTDTDLVVARRRIHSRLQGKVTSPAEPVSEGIMAYRGLIPAERVTRPPSTCTPARCGWARDRASWPIPCRPAGCSNIVAFVPTNLTVCRILDRAERVAELAAAYRGWDRRFQRSSGAMDSTFRWGIYDANPWIGGPPIESRCSATSAHAVTPHLGQGANQAIEDAMTLAVLLRDARPADLPARLRRCEQLRMGRTGHVRSQARAAGRIYRPG